MRNLCPISSEKYICMKKQMILCNFSSFMDCLMQNHRHLKKWRDFQTYFSQLICTQIKAYSEEIPIRQKKKNIQSHHRWSKGDAWQTACCLELSIYPPPHHTRLPWWCRGKEPACQHSRHKRCRFDPWVRKIPWSRNGNALQYCCPEISRVRGAWQTTV